MNTHRNLWLALGALALLFGVLACTLGARPDGAQYWWTERGPVVPHDSFPADCTLCHEGKTWRDIRADFAFDHLGQTGWALEGAHGFAECLRCHNDRGPAEMFASRGCAGCHEDVHQGRLGHDCGSCHDQNTFRPTEQIAMHNRTRFPLVGAHAATECWRCHPGAQVGRFQPADTECLACHTADLARAKNPDHAVNGWTSDCDRCHIPTAWSGSAFNHAWWPLTGAHASASCTQCHAGGVFVGTPNQCVDCHQADYANATQPNHLALGLSTNCAQCHGTSTWLGANFPHTGIVNGCVNCHQSEYNGTTNPNHVGAGFGTSCETCHDTIDWADGSFNHTQFPITSGKHKSFDCADCHLAEPNYIQFSCTHCHEHRKSEMDDEHDDVNNYVWSSNNCYACHPNGQE
jgi:hypothetical protein